MKCFIISLPKSGTYLLSNLISQFGLEESLLHIGINKYQKYDPNNLSAGRKDPLKYTHELPIEESINLVKENQIVVGHLPFNENIYNILKPFKKILLTRDVDDINQSAKRWQSQTGRGNPERTNVKQRKIVAIGEWTNAQDIFKIEFDQIINRNKKVLDDLQMYLFGQI